jgi:hypothetical protein
MPTQAPPKNLPLSRLASQAWRIRLLTWRRPQPTSERYQSPYNITFKPSQPYAPPEQRPPLPRPLTQQMLPHRNALALWLMLLLTLGQITDGHHQRGNGHLRHRQRYSGTHVRCKVDREGKPGNLEWHQHNSAPAQFCPPLLFRGLADLTLSHSRIDPADTANPSLKRQVVKTSR